MMKRMLPLLLCLLLLTGCGSPADPTAPNQDTVPIVTEVSTEPPATEPIPMEPLVSKMLDTGSAGGLTPFGDAILVFSHEEWTTLTRYDAMTLEPLNTVELDTYICIDDPAVQISDKGMTYYDYNTMELVFLDTGLKEVRRIPVPEGAMGDPALSSDRNQLYYLTENALRVVDLESGMDRLVREMAYDVQYLQGLHCDDTILELNVSDIHGNSSYLFLSVADGRLLHEVQDYATVYTWGDRYFATVMDGHYQEKLTGIRGNEVRMFHCPDPDASVSPLLAQDALVTGSEQTDGTVKLDYYRLSDGTHPYSVTLGTGCNPYSARGEGDFVWLLTYDDESGRDIIHRWYLPATAVADDTVYIGIRRTAENPDEYGLQQCAEFAAQLSERYGVQISTWLDAAAVEPWDYEIVPEYQVTVIRKALTTLDTAMSHFPEGFFAEATADMGDGVLRIGLVRSLLGVQNTGSLDTASGIQFWDNNGNAHIRLELSYGLEQNFYHELFHVIEGHIIANSQAFDEWSKLNPKGFSYDYSYSDYYYRDDYHLLDDPNRYFIDMYSMTYPKEDRARILEHACMPGNEYYFQSEHLQRKLLAICTGIRTAFDLEDVTEPFLWEQYLTEPIHAYG